MDANYSTRLRLPAIALALAFLCGSFALGQSIPRPFRLEPAASASDGVSCVCDPIRSYDVADHVEGRLFEPTGNQDQDFATMMRAHHQEGVDMANVEIASGKSTKLKAMARRIAADQRREIVELDKWTARHQWSVSNGTAR